MTTVTRWWWVRHAPVVGMDGKIYGSDDVACDTTDRESFTGLASSLPGDAIWLTSHLSRTQRTAQAIADAGLAFPTPIAEQQLGEQDFGDWQGASWDEMLARDQTTYDRFWEKPAHNRPPGGESFSDQIARVGAIIDRYTQMHAGRDIVAVTHGGTIRAAISHALELPPETGMSFTVGTLSLTRLEHIEGGLLKGKGRAWRAVSINQPAKWQP
ncbi:MAG: histidine phosphatase family protein [Rhodospirillales bacterium]|nr:histidine phosphatase family protein [Rhodospirillales bacterium]